MKASPYIVQNVAWDANIAFDWDEWSDSRPYQILDEKIAARLMKLSRRGTAAFTIATAEWITYRMSAFLQEERPWHFLEAAWLQQIDLHYSSAWLPLLPSHWTGPIRGPVRVAVERVHDTVLRLWDDKQAYWSGATSASLAQAVLPSPDVYRHWSREILDRLELFCPFNQSDPLGDVVPRQIMDPGSGFTEASAESLTNAFLNTIHWSENSLLHSPDSMLKQGFQGTPYVFDLQYDRKRRNEW